jgi:hypothetical protein
VSALERPVLHLDVSTLQGTELHLDLPEQQEPLMHLGFSKLHMSVCAKVHNYDYRYIIITH